MSQAAIDARHAEVFAALATLYDYCTAIPENRPGATTAEWQDAWAEARRVLAHAHETNLSLRVIDPDSTSCGRCGREPENWIHQRLAAPKREQIYG